MQFEARDAAPVKSARVNGGVSMRGLDRPVEVRFGTLVVVVILIGIAARQLLGRRLSVQRKRKGY